jgi:TetR/AcrR family transcriptional regulator
LSLTIWLNYMVNKKNDDTQERILAASKKIFLTKGMSGARMQDIADEAGINKALLHYYFRNKEQLFETIFKEASAQFFPKIASIIESNLPLFEKIEVFCKEYIDMIIQNPYMPLFVLTEINKDPKRLKYRIWKEKESPFEKFAAHVEKEIKAKRIKPVSPGHLFINMLSMCIFPFLSKPMWMLASGMDEAQSKLFIEQRKTEIPKFIIDSIKK